MFKFSLDEELEILVVDIEVIILEHLESPQTDFGIEG